MSAKDGHSKLALALRAGRFGLVGIAATLGYLALAAALEYLTAMPSALINAISLGASLLLSYLGHYHFTFASRASHVRKGTLFAVTTGVIVLSAVAVQALAERLTASPYASYLAVTLWYPAASFVLHNLVTFRRD